MVTIQAKTQTRVSRLRFRLCYVLDQSENSLLTACTMACM